MKLIIIGAGSFGRAVAEVASLSGKWSEIVFADDAWPKLEQAGGWSVVANSDTLSNVISDYQGVVVAIGNNQVRKAKYELLKLCKWKPQIVDIIHPTAWISPSMQAGKGLLVMGGAFIGASTKLGVGIIVNANATIDHDVVLEDFCHLGVGAAIAGGVVVGQSSWIQANAALGYHVNLPAATVVQPCQGITVVN